MTVDLSQLAKPGDPDLDIDVDGVTITSVTRMGHEIWMMARGGWGGFHATDGTEFHADPGEEVAHLTELEMLAGYPEGSPEMLDEITSRLEEWRDQATPLRVCGAPGRMFTMIEDQSRWLPFPRS